MSATFSACSGDRGDRRDLFNDRQLEPFSVWRQIRFLEFKVKVRDCIVQQRQGARTDRRDNGP